MIEKVLRSTSSAKELQPPRHIFAVSAQAPLPSSLTPLMDQALPETAVVVQTKHEHIRDEA